MREPLATVLRDRQRLLQALKNVLPYAEQEEMSLWDEVTQEPDYEPEALALTEVLDEARTLIKEMSCA